MISLRAKLWKKTAPVWDELDAVPAKAPRRRWKPSLVEVLVIAATLGVLVGLAMPSGYGDRTHRFPKAGASVGSGLAAVAGEYHQGARLGRYWDLSLLADGRYSFIWSSCTGVVERESGWVRRVGEHVVLSPVEAIEPKMERVFLAVPWGRRTYLVPPERMEEFCDAIISCDEPRREHAGDFYLRGVDQRVNGLPELPEAWANYLGEKVVVGQVVEVAEGGRARVDVGSAEGVKVGSFLTVQGYARWGRVLKAAAVDEDSCEVEEENPGWFGQALEPGWGVVMAREEEAVR